MKKLLLCMLVLLASVCLLLPAFAAESAEPTVYVSAFGNDENTGTRESPLKTLYSAVRALPTGGKVVVLDTIRVAATEFPEVDGLVTITSMDGDKDLRSSVDGNASIYLSGNLNFTGAMKFEYLDIVTAAKNLVFMCNGNYACFGEGLNVTAGTAEVNLPSIAAGRSGATPAVGTYLEIHSGNWYRVRGGSRGTSSAVQTGDITMAIYGGTFTSTFDIGGDSATDGNAYAYFYGGEFAASVNGASAADLLGDLTVSIYGGNFGASIRASRGGTIGGNVTVNVFADVGKKIALGAGTVQGTAIAKVAEGVSVNTDLTRYTMTDEEAESLRHTDTLNVEAAAKAKLPEAVENPLAGRDVTPSGSASKAVLPTAIAGDLNRDGRVTLADTFAVLKAIGGTYVEKADVNSDGRITLLDAILLIRATLNGQTTVPRGDTVNRISDTLSLYGGATVSDGKIEKGFAFGTATENAYTLYSDVSLRENAIVGLYFAADSTDPSDINGYYFEVNTVTKTLTLYRTADGIYRIVAQKNLDLLSQEARIRVTYRDGETELYFEDNPYTAESFFDFDLNLPKQGYGVGVYVENATAALPVCIKAVAKPTATYTNHILEQFTDPEVFFENGKYYLYGTRTATQNQGVQCFSTTDFINFTDEGLVLRHGDAFGDGVYKAANIVKYGDWYYLFYMAKSAALGTSVTAYASAKSPTGPFVNSTKEPLSGDVDFIGGQPFVDEDGKVYLIYARTTGGNKLYGSDITLKDGTAKLNVFGEKLLLTPTEDWENAKASVVECGFLVKHGGLYYLLYSGGNYNSTYGTGYAVAKSPLGPYTKYAHNPILVSNDQSYGVGASSPFPSPDGSEHFIIYLRNFSPTVVRPLQTCIDRIRFVKDPSGGADIIEIGGPSVNPQPLPSGITAPTLADYQYARFHW